MTAKLRWPLLAAMVFGLAAALWALGREGWHEVLGSALRVGLPGFALLCAISGVTFVILGAAWLAAAPGEPASRLPRFTWARMAREAANDLLPFSQLGGLVVGVRTLATAGIAPTRIYAAMIVDLTTEMGAQLIFTLFAIWAFGSAFAEGSADPRLLPLLWTGIGIATGLMLLFFVCQRPALRFAAFLGARMLPDAGLMAQAVNSRLADVYRQPQRVLAAFLLNLAAWGATAFWAWLGLRLIGAHASLAHAAALESAIFALRSAAFLVPGALGVQEAGYALLAPLVGIDPAAALALSLLRRARDVALGVPTMLIWQAGEMRPATRAPVV
ncbi:lysylphosphatidylglycerol synthase domain-containing protein [Sphingomonas nostoxanthinifaciens]|uniref:lysylphosphatidylglycerol synthase domain-containing protein n=1 Tax=Sphingomonas nostoxanthinifaciens TaxID=2872652 RepID=UPI001CC1C786|nr:lysylphosphatidylglycerol synthase domain-containing protein [Sphingomonas nostoxanthinifaciens]UAK23506.1 lysylphosphatidylglycerol synthase domain-containing protein [Sphingomonas nostoxanthinifaciens]